MGTEYCLDEIVAAAETDYEPSFKMRLLAYEMSGLFDVYVDIPRKILIQPWKTDIATIEK